MDQDETWQMGGLGHGLIVFEDPKKRVYTPLPRILGPCPLWQTAIWIKMPHGMVVGLGRGDCVRWGPSCAPLPPEKGTQTHIFGRCLL